MKIFSWNVNGLRAVIKKGEFAKFIEKYRPDILCLQETKAKRGQVEIDLPDYEEFWNSAERAGYSGTAIFVHERLRDERRGSNGLMNVYYDLPTRLADRYCLYDDQFGDPNREGRILTIELDDFFLTTVYTPNSKDDLGRLELRANQWDPAFRDYVGELQQKKPVIFCGDLNVAHSEIDLARPAANKGKHGFTTEERMGFSAFLDAGFVDVFRKLHPDEKEAYTWWSYLARSRERNIGWRIDYFLASSVLAKKIVAADIHPEQMGSDHCPISLTLEF
ncbi:exodeoxyribonuclease III [Candidatus Saccharibacteria bacterium]|nr:exodeoxyribonuclease III [Candidatus Saccharibacteria bacterium]